MRTSIYAIFYRNVNQNQVSIQVIFKSEMRKILWIWYLGEGEVKCICKDCWWLRTSIYDIFYSKLTHSYKICLILETMRLNLLLSNFLCIVWSLTFELSCISLLGTQSKRLNYYFFLHFRGSAGVYCSWYATNTSPC